MVVGDEEHEQHKLTVEAEVLELESNWITGEEEEFVWNLHTEVLH